MSKDFDELQKTSRRISAVQIKPVCSGLFASCNSNPLELPTPTPKATESKPEMLKFDRVRNPAETHKYGMLTRKPSIYDSPQRHKLNTPY